MSNKYDVKELFVPTIINDSMPNVEKYIKTLDDENVLKIILLSGLKDNQASGKLSANLTKTKNESGYFSVEFGFIYFYSIFVKNKGKKVKEENCLAAIVHSTIYASDISDLEQIDRQALFNPVLAKATQLTFDLTAETLKIPMGITFDLSKINLGK